MIGRQKLNGMVWLLFAYLAALAVAVIVFTLLPQWHLAWKILVADLAATLVIFGFSRSSGNSSYYDPYWSVQPMVIAAGLYLLCRAGEQEGIRAEITLGLVFIYGLRLTYNFLRTWPGLSHQDWRYDDLAKQHKKSYWWVSFSGIHMLPTILVYAGCVGMIAIFTDPIKGLGWIDLAGIFLMAVGITLEHIADQQLYDFRQAGTSGKALLDKGVWAYMRHPNYLGEILVWWGLYLLAIGANPSYWWTIVGPISIHLLFVFISIPMKDTRMLQSRPSYAKRMMDVPALWPKIQRD